MCRLLGSVTPRFPPAWRTSSAKPACGGVSRPVERIRVTPRELGNVIGAIRDCVNKYLRTWQRKVSVRISERLIVITNRAAVEGLTAPQD